MCSSAVHHIILRRRNRLVQQAPVLDPPCVALSRPHQTALSLLRPATYDQPGTVERVDLYVPALSNVEAPLARDPQR